MKHCVCLIFKVFQFSSHILVPTVCFLIFHGFHCFSPYSRSYTVCFSFSTFFSFLPIIQVLYFVFLIFHDLQFSRHTPGPIVCFLIFHDFHCFSLCSRSYTVCFSFSKVFSFFAITQILLVYFSFFMFYTVSHHIPGPTVCTSHFPRF